MKTRWTLGALALGAATSVAFGEVVFSDKFETDTSANYDVVKATAGGLGPEDSAIFFGIDYSNLEGATIPSADGEGGTTKGLYIYVNRDQFETLSVESILAIPKHEPITGDISVKFDMWFQVTPGSTTTQLALMAVGQNGARFMQGESADGYIYATTADGSSSRDYRMYISPLGAEQISPLGGWQATGTGIQNNTNPFYQGLFPSPPFPIAGTPGRQWVKCEVRRVGDDVEWLMNGTVISRVTDTAVMSGRGAVGMWDPAPSPGPDGLYVIIDNLVVEKPSAGAKVSGQVVLGDYAGAMPASATFEYREPGTTNVVKSVSGTLDAGGNFTIESPDVKGPYDLAVKITHWLRTKQSVDTTGGDVNGVTLSLVNGDVDDDNAVTVFDYNALSDAFDSVPGDANWNEMADLDGDESVSVFDYNILSNNFDLVGED